MNGAESEARPGRCPECDGKLSDPISGGVQCYIECQRCGERFDVKDPRITLP
jgi:DNA-directed RNA polymerase subunit RPC12/RpoP